MTAISADERERSTQSSTSSPQRHKTIPGLENKRPAEAGPHDDETGETELRRALLPAPRKETE